MDVLGGHGYKVGSYKGTSRYFSLWVSETVKLSSVELSSVDRCISSSLWFETCTPNKEEAKGRSAVLSAYTIVHDTILTNESVMARSSRTV